MMYNQYKIQAIANKVIELQTQRMLGTYPEPLSPTIIDDAIVSLEQLVPLLEANVADDIAKMLDTMMDAMAGPAFLGKLPEFVSKFENAVENLEGNPNDAPEYV